MKVKLRSYFLPPRDPLCLLLCQHEARKLCIDPLQLSKEPDLGGYRSKQWQDTESYLQLPKYPRHANSYREVLRQSYQCTTKGIRA